MICNFDVCAARATHVLVDAHQNKVHAPHEESEVYCHAHAFLQGREECVCCVDYPIQHEDEEGIKITLLPTYVPNALTDGVCCQHP